MAGLEPATVMLTVRSSTIEPHSNSGWLRESDSNRRCTAYEAVAGNHSSRSRDFANQYTSINVSRRKTLHPLCEFLFRPLLDETAMANDAHETGRDAEFPCNLRRGASARRARLEDRPRAVGTAPGGYRPRMCPNADLVLFSRLHDLLHDGWDRNLDFVEFDSYVATSGLRPAVVVDHLPHDLCLQI